MSLSQSLTYFAPELLLTLFAIVTLFADSLLPKKESGQTHAPAFLGVVAAGLAVYLTWASAPPHFTASLFSGQLLLDSFSLYLKFIILLATALMLLYSPECRELHNRRLGEYYMLVLVGALGMCLLVSANTMLMVYLAIEIMSLTSYLLVGFLKNQRASSEASLKYLMFGAVSSGIMLYGISILYGLTGSFVLRDIGGVIQGLKIVDPGAVSEDGMAMQAGAVLQNSYALTVSLAMILGGIAYKIAVFPFHFWSPDAYEGAPTPVAAFLSVASKAAGFGVLIRFVCAVMVPMYQPVSIQGVLYTMGELPLWPYILAVIAVLTMFVGNLAALRQEDVKRMLAYSSIAHAGYLLMGVTVALYNATHVQAHVAPAEAVYNGEGFVAVMFYLMVYAFMNLGAFLVAFELINQRGNCRVATFNGLAWRSPFLAIAMGMFLFGLAGMPPTGGFIAKVYIFKAALVDGWYVLTLLALVNSVISLFYYARVMKAMTFKEAPDDTTVHVQPVNRVVLGLCVFPVLLLGVFWSPAYEMASKAFGIW